MSFAGSLSPAISASIIARPLMSITFASPESSLDVGVFQHLLHLQDVLEFSRTSCFLMRSKLRISCVWLSGTNLARIRPGAKRSDSIVHVSLVAGHVLDMRGIRQHQLKFAVGQDLHKQFSNRRRLLPSGHACTCSRPATPTTLLGSQLLSETCELCTLP